MFEKNYLYLFIIVLTMFVSFILPLSRNFKTKRSVQSAWSTTGSMKFDRHSHAATVLGDGTVLVIGGWGGGNDLISQRKYELYDQSTGKWIHAGDINIHRLEHTSSLLTNETVLITGGCYEDRTANQYVFADVELYHSKLGTRLRVDSMHSARTGHTASVLPNGNVLGTGGKNDIGAMIITCELYNSSTEKWSIASSMHFARQFHIAIMLSDGKLLVTSSWGASAQSKITEIYDPSSGNWTITATMNVGRCQHTATLLMNGQVLVTGGTDFGINKFATAELYNRATDTWTNTTSMHFGRSKHTATLLKNGQILVTGGNVGSNSSVPNAELYDPLTKTWTLVDSMHDNRDSHTASLLSDGKVLVAGGEGYSYNSFSSTELYDPTTKKMGQCQ